MYIDYKCKGIQGNQLLCLHSTWVFHASVLLQKKLVSFTLSVLPPTGTTEINSKCTSTQMGLSLW